MEPTIASIQEPAKLFNNDSSITQQQHRNFYLNNNNDNNSPNTNNVNSNSQEEQQINPIENVQTIKNKQIEKDLANPEQQNSISIQEDKETQENTKNTEEEQGNNVMAPSDFANKLNQAIQKNENERYQILQQQNNERLIEQQEQNEEQKKKNNNLTSPDSQIPDNKNEPSRMSCVIKPIVKDKENKSKQDMQLQSQLKRQMQMDHGSEEGCRVLKGKKIKFITHSKSKQYLFLQFLQTQQDAASEGKIINMVYKRLDIRNLKKQQSQEVSELSNSDNESNFSERMFLNEESLNFEQKEQAFEFETAFPNFLNETCFIFKKKSTSSGLVLDQIIYSDKIVKYIGYDIQEFQIQASHEGAPPLLYGRESFYNMMKIVQTQANYYIKNKDSPQRKDEVTLFLRTKKQVLCQSLCEIECKLQDGSFFVKINVLKTLDTDYKLVQDSKAIQVKTAQLLEKFNPHEQEFLSKYIQSIPDNELEKNKGKICGFRELTQQDREKQKQIKKQKQLNNKGGTTIATPNLLIEENNPQQFTTNAELNPFNFSINQMSNQLFQQQQPQSFFTQNQLLNMGNIQNLINNPNQQMGDLKQQQNFFELQQKVSASQFPSVQQLSFITGGVTQNTLQNNIINQNLLNFQKQQLEQSAKNLQLQNQHTQNLLQQQQQQVKLDQEQKSLQTFDSKTFLEQQQMIQQQNEFYKKNEILNNNNTVEDTKKQKNNSNQQSLTNIEQNSLQNKKIKQNNEEQEEEKSKEQTQIPIEITQTPQNSILEKNTILNLQQQQLQLQQLQNQQLKQMQEQQLKLMEEQQLKQIKEQEELQKQKQNTNNIENTNIQDITSDKPNQINSNKIQSDQINIQMLNQNQQINNQGEIKLPQIKDDEEEFEEI